GHHAFDIRAFSDTVTVAAVVADDAVSGTQIGADADRDRLLTTVRMHHTMDVPGFEKLQCQLLEVPDQHHLAVHIDESIGFRFLHAPGLARTSRGNHPQRRTSAQQPVRQRTGLSMEGGSSHTMQSLLVAEPTVRADLYLAEREPQFVSVPPMQFLSIHGSGDPNTSAEYH